MGTDGHSGDTPEVGTTADDDESHLARSRAVWNRWADRYGMSERDFEPMRQTAIDQLDLDPGDRVLDIGCGPGVNFEFLHRAVGPTGEIFAVDYSPAMVENARARVAESGWENVTVVEGDATSRALGSGYDAAVATLAMSVMPDVRAAVENVHRSLVPGGSFAVFDLRPIPSGPGRILNPLLWRFFYWFANWNPDGDVRDALAAVFAETTTVETYAAGIAYTTVGVKRPAADVEDAHSPGRTGTVPD